MIEELQSDSMESVATTTESQHFSQSVECLNTTLAACNELQLHFSRLSQLVASFRLQDPAWIGERRD